MPIVTISKKEIERALGHGIEKDVLGELLSDYVKGEIKDTNGDELSVEFQDTNRAELWSSEGVAREIRSLLRYQKGFTEYKVSDSNYQVTVDSSKVRTIRPEIACAVVKGLTFDDASIKSLMHIQDKLDTNYGRKRKKTSIGIYDFNRIKFPVIYTTVEPNSVKFVPLGFSSEMTPKEILEQHPKGKEFGHILTKHREVPLLIDSDNVILSLPPIINSNHTGHVDTTTRDVLIEVTGTDKTAVSNVLSIVTSILSERGGEIFSVKMHDKATGKSWNAPDFEPLSFSVRPAEIRKKSGVNMDIHTIKNCLEKMSYEVTAVSEQKMDVLAPFYRKDIMHEVDIIEDVIIGYGYNNIEPKDLEVLTVGRLSEETIKEELIKDAMIGMQFQEAALFNLTGKEIINNANFGGEKVIELLNPISSSWNVLRPSLIPVMLNMLSANKMVEFPQRVFEVGDAFEIDHSRENQVAQTRRVCAAITYPKANYNDMKGVLDKLAADHSIKIKVDAKDQTAFIPGRCATIICNGHEAGLIGEIHPEVLTRFGLENPVAIMEIRLDFI